jgi:protein deglycase
MKKVVVVLAEGFEEIEALTPIDVLRRAGLEVTVAGVGGTLITGAHRVPVKCDVEVSSIESNKFDCIVLPGGMPGAVNLSDSNSVSKLITSIYDAKGLVCAICASPAVVLAPLGILEDKVAVCYPGMEGCAPNVTFVGGTPVLQCQNVITSAGPGTAGKFAFKIVEALVGKEISDNLKHNMIYIS